MDIFIFLGEALIVFIVVRFGMFIYKHRNQIPSYDRQFDETQARRVTMDKTTSNTDDLKKLAALKASGTLSESEFESEKQKILNR